MTSQKSLGNKIAVKRGSISRASVYSYVTGLSSCIPSAIGIFAIISFIFPCMTVFGFNEMKKAAEIVVLDGGKATNIADTLKYMLCQMPEFAGFAILATIILSVSSGIAVFRFSADKRTVNVYYSLGIKRTSLFTARYLAGATMLFAATVIPIVLCAIVNSIYIGVNSYLVTAVLFYSLGFFISAMFAFTVTAAVFSSVGTVIEGIVFSAGVLTTPTVLIFAAQVFITSVLYGAPYGDSYMLTDGSYVSGTKNSMVTSLSAYNPLLFFSNTSEYYTRAEITDGEVYIYGDDTLWTDPDFGLLFIWLVATAAVFIGGMLLFKSHKAEKCGFLGTNKLLNTVLTFVFGFFAFSACIYYLIPKGLLISVLVGCLVFTVIYTALELFLNRSFKLWLKKLWKLPINLALCCLVTFIFVTGGFGYSQKMPAAADVKNVSFSVPLDTSAAGVYSLSYNGYGDAARYIFQQSAILTPELTDSSDIEFAEKMHKMLIADENAEDKINCDIVFNYTMKNGHKLSRRYNYCSKNTYTAFADYFDTKSCEDAITNTLTKKHDDNSHLRILNYDETKVAVAIGLDYATETVLELDENQWDALKAAIAKDLVAMSGSEYYFGNEKQLGKIIFTQLSDEELPNMFIEGDPRSSGFISQIQYNMNSAFDVTVNEKMSYTIAYLKSIGQQNCFAPEKKIKSVTFEPFEVSVPAWMSDFYKSSPIFESRNIENYDTFTDNSFGVNKQTDEAKISQILSLSRLNAVSTDYSGYRVFIYFEDGTAVSKFLSKSDAPDYVTNYTYPEVILFNGN